MAQSNEVKVCLKKMADLQLEKASFYIDARTFGSIQNPLYLFFLFRVRVM